jgi:hypothetical protein
MPGKAKEFQEIAVLILGVIVLLQRAQPFQFGPIKFRAATENSTREDGRIAIDYML